MSVREPGDYRANVRDRYSYQPRYRSPGSGHHGVLRFLLFAVLLAGAFVLAVLTIGRPLVAIRRRRLGRGQPRHDRTARSSSDFVQSDLGTRLTQPPNDDPTEVQFVVGSGETVRDLGDRLEQEGYVLDSRAFIYSAVRRGVADDFRPGNYVLRRNMAPSEVVQALLEPRDLHTSFRVGLREGLRLEQITALLLKIKSEQGLPLDVGAFYDLVKNPPPELLADYPWLKLPKGASLEGYLGRGDLPGP